MTDPEVDAVPRRIVVTDEMVDRARVAFDLKWLKVMHAADNPRQSAFRAALEAVLSTEPSTTSDDIRRAALDIKQLNGRKREYAKLVGSYLAIGCMISGFFAAWQTNHCPGPSIGATDAVVFAVAWPIVFGIEAAFIIGYGPHESKCTL